MPRYDVGGFMKNGTQKKAVKKDELIGPKSEQLSVHWFSNDAIQFRLHGCGPVIISQAYLTDENVTIEVMLRSKK